MRTPVFTILTHYSLVLFVYICCFAFCITLDRQFAAAMIGLAVVELKGASALH